MPKKRINTLLIFAGTAVLMTIIGLAVLKIYRMTLRDNQTSHQLQQMEMAKAASLGIKTYLDQITEDMHLFTFLPEMRTLKREVILSKVDFIFKHYEEETVSAIFVTDAGANLIYRRGNALPAWVLPQLKNSRPLIHSPQSLHYCWFSSVQPDSVAHPEQGLSFFMVIPLQSGESPETNTRTVGYVSYLMDFHRLIRHFIEPLKLSKNDFAWILDGRGRLIFHPRHAEMLMRTPTDSTSDCLECHASFDMQKRMIGSAPSTDKYTISDEPPKIMAYVPVKLQNEKWILAISTFLPEVTANLRDKFRLFFILGILILLVIFALGYAVYFINSKRIRAEEAKRRSEQLQQLQQQLNQSSKLASIGELVDTVAHEINTPAGIISAHADVLLLQDTLPAEDLQEITVIKQQTRRISKYTRSLLGYSKRVPFNPAPLNVPELIDECLFLLGHRFRARKLNIQKKYSYDLPLALLDRGQMEQVFINLLNNAVDSVRKNGKITITVGVHKRPKALEKQLNTDGINVTIADNGKGIAEENFEQIFEPFYSSKPPTEGTGLGLYISRSIIQRHHGTITAHSNVQEGTAFNIFLPLNFRRNDI